MAAAAVAAVSFPARWCCYLDPPAEESSQLYLLLFHHRQDQVEYSYNSVYYYRQHIEVRVMTQPVVVEEVDENLVVLADVDILKDVHHGIAVVDAAAVDAAAVAAVQLLQQPGVFLAAPVEALAERRCPRIQNLTHQCPPLPGRVSLQSPS